MPSSLSTRTVVAIATLFVLLAGFWVLVLSPKRDEADALAKELAQKEQVLTEAQARATAALAAKRAFPGDYRKLVVLGKAVPEGDETASLLVLLNRISDRAEVEFDGLALESGSESTATTSTPPEASPTSAPEPIPPTEAEAALLPLGASVGTAGLDVMPYNLTFAGSFFEIADFIQGIERQIRLDQAGVNVHGRLITLDGFSLTAAAEAPFPNLQAEFAVTAYVTPPSPLSGEGLPGGSEPLATEAPAAPAAEPEAGATTTAAPSAYTTGEAR
jgi:Tfp pilus assembly protein PilO